MSRTSQLLRVSIGIIFVFALWAAAAKFCNRLVVPALSDTFAAALYLLGEKESWLAIFLTLSRIVIGLLIAAVLGVLLGLGTGFSAALHNYCLPAILLTQVTPVIVWMTIFIIWVADTSTITLLVLVLSILPIFYFAVYHGVHGIDHGLFQMAKVYRLGKLIVIKQIVFGAIREQLIMSLSVSLGIAWKVAITAEFVAAGSGIGSSLYWSYRNLELPQLFAWIMIVILISVLSEFLVIKPLKANVRQGL